MKTLWSALLVLTGIGLGLVLSCIAPFVAVAVFAARTLPARDAALVVAAMWLGNQAIGFGVLHYPHDATTLAWGAVILASAALAAVVARRVPAATASFVVAFVAYEAAQFAFALPTGSAADYAPAIVAQIFAANVLGVAVLAALRLVVVALGDGGFARGGTRDAHR